MPFHYSFTVERWYRDYSSVLIAQKSCRPFYILARVRSRPYSCSIFSRASAHDRIPLDEVEVRDGNVPVPSHMSTFSIEAMVRGYHVYRGIWNAALGEQLPCQREPMNSKDPFAVAVVKSQVAVGHIPRKISSICSMFLRHGGTICCRVTVSRRYSQDLPQGGLEIPCMLTFRGEAKDIENERLRAA